MLTKKNNEQTNEQTNKQNETLCCLGVIFILLLMIFTFYLFYVSYSYDSFVPFQNNVNRFHRLKLTRTAEKNLFHSDFDLLKIHSIDKYVKWIFTECFISQQYKEMDHLVSFLFNIRLFLCYKRPFCENAKQTEISVLQIHNYVSIKQLVFHFLISAFSVCLFFVLFFIICV